MTDPCRAALADERAKFEAWARSEGMDTSYWLRDPEHGYDNLRVQDYWTGWKGRAALALEAVPTEVARAFEIADEAMYEILVSEALGSGTDEMEFYRRDGTDSTRITKLADTDQHIREAFEWLQPRGYVELGTDEDGEYIRVLREPGAAPVGER